METSSSSGDNAVSDGDRNMDLEEIQAMVRTFGGLVLGDRCGTNFASYGDTRFTDVHTAEEQSVSPNATDKLPLVGGGVNTLIVQHMLLYPDLQQHLSEVGVAPIDGPYAEASRRIPISVSVHKICIPLFSIISGNNCDADLSTSRRLQEATGQLILEAVQADTQYRSGLVKAVHTYNAGQPVADDLLKELKALRIQFGK